MIFMADYNNNRGRRNNSYDGNNQRNFSKSSRVEAFDFVNPYSFVPFAGKPTTYKMNEIYGDPKSLKSGWLDVLLETKSPLIIPDGAHPRIYRLGNTEHREYSFFNVLNDQGKLEEMIPGSSLRGMIRSVYEAASNSCLPFLLDNKPISQRNPLYAGFTRRGLLEYDKEQKQWKLYSTVKSWYKAASFQNEIDREGTYCGKNNGDYVAFDTDEEGMYLLEEDQTDDRHGWLQYNRPVNAKGEYNFTVLQKAEETPIFEWEQGDFTPYKSLLSALRGDGAVGNQGNSNEVARKALEQALERVKENGGCVPVWFLYDKKNREVYLSGASIGRVGRRRHWEDILEDHTTCDSLEALCPACLLFGTTKGKHTDVKNSDSGLRGRLRFTDAEPIHIAGKEKHTLQILGMPRPSSFEFYLDKPQSNAAYWNFDYYSYSTGENSHEFEVLEKATPRGRKMYWHGQTMADRDKRDKQNSTMEAVSIGSVFRFRIYFDRITEQQLQDLIWVITLGDNRSESTRQHKLGHARPLGYGSVKLTVDKQYLRVAQMDDSGVKVSVEESVVDTEPTCSFDIGAEAVQSLLAICDTKSVAGKQVCYPLGAKTGKKDSEEIYLWFAQNRTNANSVQTLPYPTDEDITLRGKRLTKKTQSKHPLKNRNSSKTLGQHKERIPVGTVLYGETTGMNKTGNYVYIQLENNKGRGSAYVGRSYPRGKRVQVRVKKYNEEYKNYTLDIILE